MLVRYQGLPQQYSRMLLRLVQLVCFLSVIGFLQIGMAHAQTTLTIDATASPGSGLYPCSDVGLEQAIIAATDGDTIFFNSNCSNITLSNGSLLPYSLNQIGLVIDGNGVTLNITANNERHFNIENRGVVTIANMTLTGGNIKRTSAADGGSIYNENGDLNIVNVIFDGNSVTGVRTATTLTDADGGAIYSLGARLSVSNSIFRNNTSTSSERAIVSSVTGRGGAIVVDQGAAVIQNSLFDNNTALGNSSSDGIGTGADGRGGAIFYRGTLESGVRMTLINNTFVNNEAKGQDGGNGRGGAVFSASDSTIRVYNNIFIGNNASNSGDDLYNANSTGQILENTIYFDINGTWLEANNLPNTNPQFTSLLTGDYSLRDTSPAIGAGSDTVYTSFARTEAQLNFDVDGDGSISSSGVTIDLEGMDRFVGTIDMGAYENTTCLNFVNYTLTAPLVENLTAAIECNNRDGGGATITIPNGSTISFTEDYNDTGTALPTISEDLRIVGQGTAIIERNSSATDFFRFFRIASNTNLDLINLTLRDARLDTNAANVGGAVAYNQGTLNLINSTVSTNGIAGASTALNAVGGAIFNDLSATLNVINSVLDNNFSLSDGGAIFNRGTLLVLNSLIYNNVISSFAGGEGGGIANIDGDMTIINTTITKNITLGNGGGIFDGSTLAVYNSIITDNNADMGADIFEFSTSSTIENTVYGDLEGTPDVANNNIVWNGTDALFSDAANNDFTLSDTSIAINVGNDATYTANVPSENDFSFDIDSDGTIETDPIDVDLANNDRVVGIIDAGAYEASSGCALYVFPYTLTNSVDYASELTDAIRCANVLGGTNTINLPDATVSLSDDYENSESAFPQITSNINFVTTTGTFDLQRSSPVDGFRFFNIASGTTVTMDGLTFEGGGGVNNGAAILNVGNLTISDANFDTNIATLDGGAIANFGTLNITSDADFEDNSAGDEGGAIYNGGLLVVNDATFLRNNAAYGGSINNSSGIVTVTASNLQNGSATELGGAINNFFGLLDVRDTLIINNIANETGGGIYSDGDLTLVDTRFLNNRTSDATTADSAGIRLNTGNALIANSTFFANISEGGEGTGGFLCRNSASQVTIVNTVFIGNQATAGNSGAIQSFCDLTIVNSTIGNNSTSARGGGIRVDSGTTRIYNSIVYGNSADIAANEISVNSGTVTIQSSLYDSTGVGDSIVDGGGNITDQDPKFVSSLDLSLLPDSPALNAGDNALLPNETMQPASGAGSSGIVLNIDIDGDAVNDNPIDVDFFNDDTSNPRIFNITVDMGAYEFQGVGVDVNGDGIVSPVDVVYVVNRIGTSDLSADVDGDGDIDNDDAILVQSVLGRIP